MGIISAIISGIVTLVGIAIAVVVIAIYAEWILAFAIPFLVTVGVGLLVMLFVRAYKEKEKEYYEKHENYENHKE
jgi:c-di-AMP phosphodiesterase-like protein